MNFINNTKNQHFIPKVEQKLNASNPTKTKIFSFIVNDREKYDVMKPKSVSIENNLSLYDLFSFDVIDRKNDRYNFENLFYRYESNLDTNTISLLDKLKNRNNDVKKEIIEIFVSKIINFVRNPYSIKKVLNTFPSLLNLHPLKGNDKEIFENILHGKKPQQDYLCRELNISNEEYSNWLKVIFLLLTPFESEGFNILEYSIKELLESVDNVIQVHVYTYSDYSCLLSDRGYSIPIPDREHMAWDFNLCSHGFIQYIFGDLQKLLPNNIPVERILDFKHMPKEIKVYTYKNDYNKLESYNKNVIYQCCNRVFNSTNTIYGL